MCLCNICGKKLKFCCGYFVICRIYRAKVLLFMIQQHLSLLRKPIICCAQMFSLLFTVLFYDYDEPIGMCSRLIIHNLTRVSSGLQHRLHAAASFHCRFFVCLFDDMLPEMKIPMVREALDDSAKNKSL